MHKIVINARIVKIKHTLLASTVWLKWTVKLYQSSQMQIWKSLVDGTGQVD